MSVCQALAALSQVKPVLIIFDDMEHADEATLEVVARGLPQDGRILFCGSRSPTRRTAGTASSTRRTPRSTTRSPTSRTSQGRARRPRPDQTAELRSISSRLSSCRSPILDRL